MARERPRKGERRLFIIIRGDFPRAFLTVFNYFSNLWSIDVPGAEQARGEQPRWNREWVANNIKYRPSPRKERDIWPTVGSPRIVERVREYPLRTHARRARPNGPVREDPTV